MRISILLTTISSIVEHHAHLAYSELWRGAAKGGSSKVNFVNYVIQNQMKTFMECSNLRILCNDLKISLYIIQSNIHYFGGLDLN